MREYFQIFHAFVEYGRNILSSEMSINWDFLRDFFMISLFGTVSKEGSLGEFFE